MILEDSVLVTNLLQALGLVALTFAINIPLLLLAKRWYKEESPVPIVRRHPAFPTIGLICVALCALVLPLTVYAYIARVSGASIGFIIAFGPVLMTAANMLLLPFSRWRISIYDDGLIYRPSLGKTKEIPLADITSFAVVKGLAIKVFSDKKRPILSVDSSIGFYDFQKWAESTSKEIEYHEPPASIDVSVMPNR